MSGASGLRYPFFFFFFFFFFWQKNELTGHLLWDIRVSVPYSSWGCVVSSIFHIDALGRLRMDGGSDRGLIGIREHHVTVGMTSISLFFLSMPHRTKNESI